MNAITDTSGLIDALGGSAAVAAYLGVGISAVSNWRKRRIPAWAIPMMRQMCGERGIDAGDLLEPIPPRRAREKAA